MRRAPQMPIQEKNLEYAAIAKQIKDINPSEGYRNDFRNYLNLLRDRDDSVRVPSWYSLFVKMMWAMQAKYPEQVNLKTITKAQILEQQLPCLSVKTAVEDGLLTKVPGYQYLNKEI